MKNVVNRALRSRGQIISSTHSFTHKKDQALMPGPFFIPPLFIRIIIPCSFFPGHSLFLFIHTLFLYPFSFSLSPCSFFPGHSLFLFIHTLFLFPVLACIFFLKKPCKINTSYHSIYPGFNLYKFWGLTCINFGS